MVAFEFSWAWVWLLLAAGLIIGEIFTAGFFLLPFGIGAVVAAFTAWLGGSPTAQWITFLGVSMALLVPLRRVADRRAIGPDLPVAGNRTIGKVGTVLEQVRPHGITGRVRVGSEQWRAEALGEESLPRGTSVEVLAVNGTHLLVRARTAQAADGNQGGA